MDSAKPRLANADTADRAADDARTAAERLLASIVSSSHDAIVSKSRTGIIQSWNAAAERMFGYSAAEAIGRHISLIIPPERLSEEDEIMSRLTAGELIDHYETIRVRRDGGRLAVALTISPMKDASGQLVGASKIARDITSQKEAEARERTLRAMADETSAKFEAFFEQGAIFAAIANPDGTIIDANRLSWQACGYRKDEIVGRPFWEAPWWSPSAELVDHIREGCGQALRGRAFRSETPYYVASGEERIADIIILPITDDTGRVMLLAPTGTDVTDRKRAEAAVREGSDLFRTLADNMSQFAWMADAQGSIFWYNKRWFDYTGTTLDEMRGWGWTKVHHPEHVDRVVERVQYSWDTGEEWEDVFPLRGRDGTYRWFLSRATAIRDEHGAIVRWFGTNTDITEHRRLEEDLRTLTVELAAVNRRKDAFLATLSHELRNPLGVIRNALAVMKLAQGEPDKVDRARGALERQVAQMARLLDDLLDVSRISRDKLELKREKTDLVTIIHDVVDAYRPVCAQARLAFHLDLPDRPVALYADATRLTQVFGNLLLNAAKYTPAGGSVWLTATAEDAEVVVTVRDTGIGIPPDMLSSVFEMFAQLEQRPENARGGLGIGLSLVQRFVTMHGGSVDAASEGPNAGSTFTVRLPFTAEGDSRPTGAPDIWFAAGSSRRVLVVDDDRDGAGTLVLLLESSGHVVDVAHDGIEALHQAETFKPDVVLLDLGLPKLTGHDVCRALREQPWGRSARIVALTGLGQDDDRRATQDAGFDAHLVKPVDPAELIRLLGA